MNQNPGINNNPEILETMTPSAAKEIKEAADSKFFSDQFVSVEHITHCGIRETEAGYWNYFQPKQEFSKLRRNGVYHF